MERKNRKTKPATFNDLTAFVEHHVQPMHDQHGPDVFIEFLILTRKYPATGRKEFAPGLWADIVRRSESGHLVAICPAGAFLEAVNDQRILHHEPKRKKART